MDGGITLIGYRIKSIRNSLGISQKELSHDLCTQSNISKIEKGLYSPSLYLCKGFAEKLNVSVEFLYSGIEGNNFESFKERLFEDYCELRYEKIEEFLNSYKPNQTSNYEKKMMCLMRAVVAYQIHKNIDLSRNFLLLSEKILSEVNDYKLELAILHVKAIIFRDVFSNEEILEIYKKLTSMIFVNDCDDKMTIKILLSISTFYYHNENYKKVHDISKFALSLLEKNKSRYLLNYHLYNAYSSLHYLGSFGEKEKLALEYAKYDAMYFGDIVLLENIEEILGFYIKEAV